MTGLLSPSVRVRRRKGEGWAILSPGDTGECMNQNGMLHTYEINADLSADLVCEIPGLGKRPNVNLAAGGWIILSNNPKS